MQLPQKFSRVILVGDTLGISQSLDVFPNQSVAGIIISSLRPQYFESIQVLSAKRQIPVLNQPRHLSPEYKKFMDELTALHPDLLFCNSYSMLIRSEMLEIVNRNAINVHWALLPRNRGPNPTQWAIIKDEKKTGVTVHYMDEGVDSGDIVAQAEETIFETDTWVSVNKRLADKALALMQVAIPLILSGIIPRTRQDEKKATVNKRLIPDFPKIDFEKMSDRQVFNLIRAQCAPLPGAFLIDQAGNKFRFNQYLNMKEVSDLRRKYAS